MTEGRPPGGPDLDAGDLGQWVTRMERALAGAESADVPCGGCTACCRSSQFVHVGPEETATLARIPRAVRFPAPGLPPGHWVLGYDAQGRCPMLGPDGCSIYEDRPRACRTYDCRLFAATGVDPGATRPEIAARVARWRFSCAGPETATTAAALRAAGDFLAARRGEWPGEVPVGEAPLALAVLEVHDLFVRSDPATGDRELVQPAAEAVRERLAYVRRRSTPPAAVSASGAARGRARRRRPGSAPG